MSRLRGRSFRRPRPPLVGQGQWPDCDMLPLGPIGLRSVDGGGEDRITRLTRDDQRDNDEWTLSLLTNPEVIALNHGGATWGELGEAEGRVAALLPPHGSALLSLSR